MLLQELPADNRFRLVKWIDRFRLHASGSRDVAVDVLFEELPVGNEQELAQATPRQVREWLGKASWQEARPSLIRALSVGLLPLLRIGQVFCGQQPSDWSLSVEHRTITIDHADLEPEAARLRTRLPPPPGWLGKIYGWLNPYEYYLELESWNSNLLVIPSGEVDVIIPRTVIFQSCYAPTEDFAHALTHGPWRDTASEVLYLGPELESGLQTRRNRQTGTYEVILQTPVHDTYANLLALLFFDPYARTCADQLHTDAWRERGGNSLAFWHANARLPVYGTATEPLTLQLDGWALRTTSNAHARARFLVTSITRCSWPAYVRPIMHERINSKKDAAVISGTYARQPWFQPRRSHEAGADLTVSSQQDASARLASAHARGENYTWAEAPKPETLTKRSYKVFLGPTRPLQDDGEPTTASPNSEAHGAGLPNKLHAEAISRDPVKRFEYLLAALAELAPEVTTTVVIPEAPWGRTNRGDQACWSFRREIHAGRRREGWEMIEKKQGSGPTFRPGLPRAALVLELRSLVGSAYWIEIETRGAEGYCAVVMTTDGGPRSICAAMEAIADARGANLRTHVPPACRDRVRQVQTPEHRYAPGSETKVTSAWVAGHLAAVGVLQKPRSRRPPRDQRDS